MTDEPALTYPPTIIVVHPKERRAKCTVRPLRPRADFRFCNYPRVPAIPPGYVRLGLGGPVLSAADTRAGLLFLDGTWRWAERMEGLVADVPVRTLPPLVTAYPRVSKVSEDPASGLATIEAVYAAFRLLGRSTEGLLDQYHWAEGFLARNAGVWGNSQAKGRLPIAE